MRQAAGFPRLRFMVCALAAAALAGCGGSDDDDARASATAEQACAALAGKTVAGAVVATAATVAASGAAPLYCKVDATIAPQLKLELRLPQQWNGKLYYGGGGGYNGSIPDLSGNNLNALTQGYATVNSDSGHSGNGLSADFALNDAQAAALFGSQSVPTVTASAKAMVQTAYGKQPDKAYFEGCSNGGREALMAAQRNPELFDGIIARAPAYNWAGFMGQFNRTAKALAAPGGAFTPAKVATLAAAVRNACDADDGIVDGVVAHPQACTFDPTVLRCEGGADTGDACLSDAQLAVVSSWTSPAAWAGGAYTNPGWQLSGNEDDPGAWAAWVSGTPNVFGAAQYLFQDTTVKNYLARNPAQDSLTYTWDSDVSALNALAALNDATNTDLRPLSNRNAKLILWHGGNDSALSHKATTAFYQAATAALGGQAAMDGFARYYIAPGVNHCAGGPGADTTDLLSALDAWVDKGTAPGTLTATKVVAGAAQFARPLCAYPQYPRYTGPAGDTAAAALASSYTCTTP
jgi:alpha-beta hydrolase superfamily lysophospholipase